MLTRRIFITNPPPSLAVTCDYTSVDVSHPACLLEDPGYTEETEQAWGIGLIIKGEPSYLDVVK